jgi:hypothetical protein
MQSLKNQRVIVTGGSSGLGWPKTYRKRACTNRPRRSLSEPWLPGPFD